MKAGAELDALVAEKVMGWSLDKSGSYYVRRGTSGRKGWVGWFSNTDEDDLDNPLWSPSTSIADAWEVVEHLQSKEHGGAAFELSVESPFGAHCWEATFWLHRDKYVAIDHDGDEFCGPSYAICLAALKAVGHPMEDKV